MNILRDNIFFQNQLKYEKFVKVITHKNIYLEGRLNSGKAICIDFNQFIVSIQSFKSVVSVSTNMNQVHFAKQQFCFIGGIFARPSETESLPYFFCVFCEYKVICTSYVFQLSAVK